MTTKNIHQRCHAIMSELQGVELVKTAGLKFKIIQHDDVTSALRPLYLKHGVDQQVDVLDSRQLEGGTTELVVEVTWINIDNPADKKTARCVGHATSHPDKQTGLLRRDDLGVGKALSYAVKMAQLKNFALLSGDGDLETDQSKPQQSASVDDVERVLNMLASAKTRMEFDKAAKESAELGGVTAEQKQILGAAWSAAKKRLSEEGNPMPPDLGKDEKPEGLPSEEMEALMARYKAVRTPEELSPLRREMGSLKSRCSKAQWAVLAELDAAANKLIKMQQEAAHG